MKIHIDAKITPPMRYMRVPGPNPPTFSRSGIMEIDITGQILLELLGRKITLAERKLEIVAACIKNGMLHMDASGTIGYCSLTMIKSLEAEGWKFDKTAYDGYQIGRPKATKKGESRNLSSKREKLSDHYFFAQGFKGGFFRPSRQRRRKKLRSGGVSGFNPGDNTLRKRNISGHPHKSFA